MRTALPADLITQVNQMRASRNWAADSRRESPTNLITPLAAYNRLKAFLADLAIGAEPERIEPEHE